ncbi:MAG TPA: hypothetical protein VFU17_15415 [Candidatus Limnocylindrales bacterium]|nr:hypothetical protein [Candidatus Limnocylindrales bacterium]
MNPDDVRRWLRTIGLGAAWVAIALLISAGAAGLVVGMDHIPGTAARAELTADADAAAEAALDDAQAKLEDLTEDVKELGVLARGALASLSGQDLDTVQQSVDQGAELVAGISDRSRAIQAELLAIPGIGGPTAELSTSADVRRRHAAMLDALAVTEGLDDAWVDLTTGSLAAARLSRLLADHDRIMGDAVLDGRAGKYDSAIEKIDEAAAVLTEADTMRVQLANTVDVSTLIEWIRRNRNYEDALRSLYATVVEAGGRQTAAVREAIAAERSARKELPPDARGLVVIMAEIGRGGLNGAVITIEEARGRLANALEAATPGSPPP